MGKATKQHTRQGPWPTITTARTLCGVTGEGALPGHTPRCEAGGVAAHSCPQAQMSAWDPPTPTWPWVSSLWPRPCGVQAWARSDSWAQRRGYWPPLSPAAKFKVGQHEPGQWALIGGEGLLPTSRRPQHRDPGHSPLDRTWHERVPQPPTSSTWAQFAFVCRFRCW